MVARFPPTAILRYGRRWRSTVWRVLLLAAAFVLAVPILAALAYRVVGPPATPLMLVRLVEGHGIDYRWRPLSEISPHLVRAAIASEDNRFCLHDGFDWVEMELAWAQFQRTGRLRGASTISMQTARNIVLWPGRDWIRKGLEAYVTTVVEALWPKERIMEVYLNIAEFGPGIYGAEAAAQRAFGKPASSLTEAEAALLVTVLPNPLGRSAAAPSTGMRNRAATVRRIMGQLGAWTNCAVVR